MMNTKRTVVAICFIAACVLSLVQPSIKKVNATATIYPTMDTYVATMYRSSWLSSSPWLREWMEVGFEPRYGGTIVPGPDGDTYILNIDAYRAYIKFDLDPLGIPLGSNVDTATLYLVRYDGSSIYKWCERVTSNWAENTLQWDTQPSFVWSSEDAISANTVFDVKSIVKQWITYGQSNYGFVLFGGEYGNERTLYYTSNSANPPSLTITWSYNTLVIFLLVEIMVITQEIEERTTTKIVITVMQTTVTATGTL